MKPRSCADGVVVAAVRARTPAADAGLLAGDRILSVNGHAVRDAIDFQFHTADDRRIEVFVDVQHARHQSGSP